MSNIEFILSLQPLFDKWKQTQVFQPTGEEANKLNAVHREIFGRNLPNCNIREAGMERSKGRGRKYTFSAAVMAFSNPRQNFLIDDVEWDRDGEIKVHHGNFTAVDWYEAESNVWVQLEG